MWREFFIMGYKVVCKVYDNPSQYGIAAIPRISKLSIFEGKTEVFNYDRGLDVNHLPEFLLRGILRILDHLI